MFARSRTPSARPSATSGAAGAAQDDALTRTAGSQGGGMEAARALLGSRVTLAGPIQEDGRDARPMVDKLRALRLGIEAADTILADRGADAAEAEMPAIAARFGMQWLTLEEDGDSVRVEGKVNPHGKGVKRPREEDADDLADDESEDDSHVVKHKRKEDGGSKVTRTDRDVEKERKARELAERRDQVRRTYRRAPLLRPDRTGDSKAKEIGFDQPISRFSPGSKKKNAWKPPGRRTKYVAKRPLPDTTGKPQSERVRGLEKFKAPTKTLKEELARKKFERQGSQQAGFRPEGDDYGMQSLGTTSYQGKRAAQVLMQLSQVMRGLSTAKATEVQFGYGYREDGELDVYSSANESDAQKELLARLGDPGKALREAALSDDPRLARVAMKLLNFDEQEKKRRAKGGEKELDLELARKIRDKVLGGPVTVAMNPNNRHAEQNIVDVMANAHEKTPYLLGDIQGTKLRCGACTGGLGKNAEDEDGKGLSGNIWPSQASRREIARLLAHVHDDDHVFSSSTRRYDSDSEPDSFSEDSMDEEVEEKIEKKVKKKVTKKPSKMDISDDESSDSSG